MASQFKHKQNKKQSKACFKQGPHVKHVCFNATLKISKRPGIKPTWCWFRQFWGIVDYTQPDIERLVANKQGLSSRQLNICWSVLC